MKKGLRSLPRPALDDLTAERVRRRARAALSEPARARAWRVLLPSLLTGATGVYLLWAVQAAGRLCALALR